MEINFFNEAAKIKNFLISHRRDFHMHPELDFELDRTSNIIKKFLDEEGIEYYSTAKTGICAIIRGNGEKTIALRGDMDALPLKELSSCEYKSKVEGKMHACGHDAHTTILMGAAKVLNKHRDKLKGNVKFLFEPAEETTGGASIMIKEGVLSNPEVNCVIGLHVEEKIQCGEIGIKKGVVNAASNPFTIKIKGKGAHGARPDAGIDPIVIACNVVTALQTIVSRELPPTDAGVITVGSIHGGTAQNIIPEEVKIEGVIRTIRSEHREYVVTRLKQITEGITSAMRGSCEITVDESYPCLYNDDEMVDLMCESAKSILGKENINILQSPSMGVESFAYFSMKKPAVFYYLGSGNKEKGIVNPAHGAFFDIDEECLPIGVALQCTAAYNFLNK